MLPLLLLLAVLLAAAYVLVRFYDHLNYWNKRGIFYEKPHYLYGNLAELESTKNLSSIHKEFYNKYSSRFPYMGFFFHLKPSFLVFDLDVAKDILIKDFSNFTSKFRYLNETHDPMTATLLNLQGSKWHDLRKDLTVAFTPCKVKASFKRVHLEAEKLGNTIGNLLKNEADIDVRELIVRHITNVIVRFALGVDSKSFESDVYYEKALEILNSSTNFYNKGCRAMISSFPRYVSKLGIKVVSKDMDSFLINTVRAVLKIREDNGDFMSVFLKMKNVTVEKISAQVYSFMEASLVTTSTTICTAIYELAMNQDVQTRLRNEILEYLDNWQGDCNYGNIKECKYLEQVMFETLRKYPIATQLSRVCENDYKIKKWNITLEKDVLVIIPISAIHMDPEIYPNPDRFDPDRFTPEAMEGRHTMAYSPFGEGGRSCIGREFGKLMVKLTLIELLRRFKFSPCPKTDIPMKLDLTQVTLPAGEIFLRVESL